MALKYIFFVFFVHVCHNGVMNKEELNYLHDMINQRLDQDGQKYEMACAYAEQADVDLKDIIDLRNLMLDVGKDMDEILNTYSDEEIDNNEEILDELDRLNNLSDGLLALIVENKMDPKDVKGS